LFGLPLFSTRRPSPPDNFYFNSLAEIRGSARNFIRISTFISTTNRNDQADSRQKLPLVSPHNFRHAKRENFRQKQVSVLREPFAAPTLPTRTFWFRGQVPKREARARQITAISKTKKAVKEISSPACEHEKPNGGVDVGRNCLHAS